MTPWTAAYQAPWDSPGKNTGVGCHFLLQCMKVKVKSLSQVQLSATPWTAAYQAPPPMDCPGKSTGVGCHCLLCSRSQGMPNFITLVQPHLNSSCQIELFFFHNGGVLTFWQLSIKTEEEESEEKEASAAEEEEEEEKKTGGGGEKTVRGGGRGGKEKISFSSMILPCLYRYLQTKVI